MANGLVVLITGASRGFGAAAARLIASRGNTVIATMRNPERDAGAVVEGFEGAIHPVALDVTDPEAVRAVVADAITGFGQIDVLINNAGYGLYGPVEDASEEQAWGQVDTNLLGQWRMCAAVLPSMRERDQGKIVNVSSLAGRIPGPLLGHYAASKFGVEAMSEALRLELAGTGVQVTIIEPGMFASDWQTTNLNVCEAQADGVSPYQDTADRGLDNFRALAATKPGSGSVAAAMADITELEQRLPMRWPVGNDAVHMIPLRMSATDEEWEHLRRSGAFGGWRTPLYDGIERLPEGEHDWSGGNVVLITGGSRGFGAAAARECAARGDTVVATMRNPERDGPGVVEGFEGRIHPERLDVTETAAVESVVGRTIERFGRIDVLVNNAGYGLYGPVEDFTEEEVRRQIDTNYIGQWRLLRAVAPRMRAQRYGKIVNVSSLSGQVPSKLMGFYAASKHMVEALSEVAAEELSHWNVQVCILEPGMYRSDWQTTNLDVCQKVRAGQSAYQPGVEASLEAFRKRAATRPGSDAVAMALADISQLQQRLPLRWPIGDDAVAMIPLRRRTPDADWEARMAPFGWSFRREEMRRQGAMV